MKNIACTLASVLVLAQPSSALAQASCSSDGTPQPVAIFERFISADCEACWTDAAIPSPSATAGAVVLDWIVPGQAGDEAPLSAAATNDALARLQALGRTPPAATDVYTAAVEGARPARLRVAHGLPLNDYLGTAIAFTPARRDGAAPDGMAFYLLLVESVPAGTEGTRVGRNMVRNMLHGTWDKRNTLSNSKQTKWMESRSMRIPDGAQPERLRMVGWVQDAQGRVVAAAQSACR
ncbi:hypothetical protein KYG_03059 [Acidovorax sp. NO-1]|uniref:hypothetical protein n=1 Tax=Acidovorax sp. NO-1 TaxID=512030 RepID=UPI00023FCDEB|nr:hypothetical protein [Acidovorax sp. NO-1]EHL24399.1 hypothetical protein KYG_03059 [Acidovorax sp. NO-1]